MGAVVVSGSTGYVGSHVVRRLVREGRRVVALKRSTSDMRRLESISRRIATVDVDDPEWAAKVGGSGAIEAVVHAATSYGRRGESETEVRNANVAFPLALLEVCAKAGARSFLNMDTVLPAGLNLYSSSKAEFRRLATGRAADLKLKYVDLCLEQVFGPWDDESKFPTFVIRACASGRPAIDLSPGDQVRDFVYVDDAVDGIIIVLNAMLRNSYRVPPSIDVGSGHPISIRHFAERVKSLTHSNTQLNFGALPYRKGEPMESLADTTELVGLGWSCRVGIDDGIVRILTAEKLAEY